MDQVQWLILGAGLSGLSAAYHLSQRCCDDWRILEKTDRVGGLCASNRYSNGFTFDQSIHILFSSDPYAAGLIKKLLGGNLKIQKRKARVYCQDVYTLYPWQVNTHGLPVEMVKECLLGVIKATYERDPDSEPQNFEEWCYITFGDGIAKHFLIPYNQKLWAIDLKQMTDSWIKDRVLTPSLDDVIEGALDRKDKGFGPNSVFWYPKTNGIEALPNAFLNYLDRDKIEFNSMANRIYWQEKQVADNMGRQYHYDKLVSSLPLPTLIKCMQPELSPDLQAASGRLAHNTVIVVNIAVQKDNVSPYHWVYFPEDKYLLHRVSFPKNFSKAMAPDGWSSITAEIATTKFRQLPRGDKLIGRVITDLKEAKIITNGDHVEVKSVGSINPAYVIYNHTHRSNVDQLHRFLHENAIIPCGRFGEWEYFNMDHSILSGHNAVQASQAAACKVAY